MNLTTAKFKARMQAHGPDGRGMGALQLVLLLLVIGIGLSSVQPALAYFTLPKTPGADVGTATGWTNFSYTTLASASSSLATAPNSTNPGTVSTFAFGVPAGAQIDGIQVHVKGQSNKNNNTSIFAVELSGDGGSTWTTAGYTGTFTDSSPQEDVYLGGSTLDWGWSSAGWDGDNCSNSNFQLQIWNTTTGQTVPEIELVEVTIWYTPVPEFTQAKFRGRNDDGGEAAPPTGASWKAAENTDWNQMPDTSFRVRFLIQQTDGYDVSDKSFQLQYRHNGGSWTNVTGSSSYVKAVASGTVSDGTDTTEQMSGSQNFLTGDNNAFDGGDGVAGGGTAMDFTGANDEVELEYCLQIVGADTSVADAIELRVFDTSSTYISTEIPIITVSDYYDQVKFRARNDDGGEAAPPTGASWKFGENVNWTQAVGENFRVRFLVHEDTDQSEINKTFQLEYSHNSGPWTNVTGSSSVVKAVASGTVTDGTDTTEQMNGSQTFKSPNDGFDGSDGVAGGSDLDFGAGLEEVELEFCLQIIENDVVNNDTIQLRIKALNAYSNTPTITVSGVNCDFSTYKKITIDNTLVETTLTNFPVMIELTGTHFQQIEDDITDPQGGDIMFRVGSKIGTLLDHEIEVYDTTNDKLVAWVKVPSLSGSSDTEIYMWYGNRCATSSLENASGVWSNGYEAVYHLHDDYLNSEGTSARDGTPNGAVHTSNYDGQIAEGADFESDDPDDVAISNWSWTGDEITIQAWMKWESRPDNAALFDKSFGTGAQDYVWNLSKLKLGSNHRLRGYIKTGSTAGSGTVQVDGSTNLNQDTWYFVVLIYDGSNIYLRYNDQADNSASQSGNLYTLSSPTIQIGNHANDSDDPFDGFIDEVRISSVARSNQWLDTEYNNQSNPAAFYTVENETAATAISLVSFTAKGDGNAVKVEWQTGAEVNNVGFHLYHATSPGGPYTQLTDQLISARPRQGQGASYSFFDSDVAVGSLYYYKLEDIDVYGKRTMHGPISVDWDADGLPDDWEITHGLSPWVNDADLDYDGDGLSNFEEYERDLDPFNADTDGDGIRDGAEDGRLPVQQDNGSRSISRGVEVLASDDSGMTIALNTSGFEAEVIPVDGAEYERLYIADYVHGYTSRVGTPQLPLKGLLIDVPEGKAAELSVLNSSVEPYGGYRIYPVPEAILDAQNGMAAVGAVFVQDDLAYNSDGLYPQEPALLGQNYVFRDQVKQQVIFYPLRFNPASGQLILYRRIELRIDFVEARYAHQSLPLQMPWQPPETTSGLLSSMAMSFAAAPVLVNPISPILASLGATVTAIWSPPAAAAGGVYKILTDAEGIYRITKDFLDTNGVDTSVIDLSQVRLYNLGDEIAIEIFDQNSDDQFDAGDYIIFYALPVDDQYAKYSAQNIYWLTLSGGAGLPKRMGIDDGSPADGLLGSDFPHIAHYEKDQIIWIAAPGADGIDRWFFNTFVQGTEHAGGGLPVSFIIPLPDPTSAGTLTILMAGQTDADHVVNVAINGVEQSFSWNGISYYEVTLDDVPIVDGDNTVTLQCLSADGNDSIIVDWFDVAYRRDYVTAGNILKFSPDSGSRYLIEGFSSSPLLAYDISNSLDLVKIDNAFISDTNPYSFEFEPTTVGSTYLVLAPEVSKIPVGLIEDTAANLALNASGADYMLITHRDLGWDQNGDELAWLTDLVAHRQDQGLRVFVADIEDIYDEFSYGIQSPQALKDFLAYAYSNWTAPAPQYVLLVGDSTYDPKGNWNMGDTTAYLPTYLIYTDHKGETVTDQWFVTFSGEDVIADMHIGRLPAADATQAAVMVNKILTYETTPNTKFDGPDAWEKNILLVADNQRLGDEYLYEEDFAIISEDAAALLPAPMNSYVGYLGIHYADAAYLTNFITSTLNNDGALIVNYAGHAATQVWAHEHILDTGDIAGLTNTEMLPFFVSMSCETGFFAYPENWLFPSLAEALLRSKAGAVAALMPTAMTTTAGQRILNSALYEQIFSEDIRTLGPAIAAAKQTLLANGAHHGQVSDTFLLFGDPATQLKVPLPRMPKDVTIERRDDGVRIRWQAAKDSNGNPVDGYNVYRAGTAAGQFSRINSVLITETRYLDTGSAGAQGSAVSASANYYYGVTAVDAAGDESAQTLGISPPSPGAGSNSGGGGGGGGCFITTTATAAFNSNFNTLIIIVSILLGFCLLQIIVKPQSKKNAPKNKKNPFNELKKVKTLLVDDDEFIRNSLELAFRTKGCCLQVAETAEEGLQAIREEQFDIIISDFRLPGMNGLDFLKLTADTQPQAVKFLITAYRDDHIFSEAIRLGIHECIEKPFAVKVLINLLALALKRQISKQARKR
jgi:CheY-like chemotaxis protein